MPAREQPLYFGPPGEERFGWYHAPTGSSRGEAVVLVNPLGLDMTRSHRSYRHLALRLAAAGFAVLRFDYLGTGDSAGDERDPDRARTWVEDTRLAIEQLERLSGLPSVSLVGLRFGAAMAAHVAATRDDVERVVLWTPCASGAAWVAEMVKQHKLYGRLVPQGGPAEPGGEELLGTFLNHRAIEGLGAIDLYRLPRRPAPSVLGIDDGMLRDKERMRQHLADLGATVEWRSCPGQRFLISVPHRATLPEPMIDGIVAWLSTPPPRLRAPAAVAAPVEDRRVEARSGERPIRFGDDRRRFGILVPPRGGAHSQRPAIVLTNAGTVNRVGPHRSSVTLARRWAELGFFVLRVDLSGIGDSPASEGTPENLTYPRDRLLDVATAMDALGRESGAERFVIAGLCSGGDLAFQMAHRDPRVVGAVMMNPRTFLELDLERVEGQEEIGGPPAPAPDPISVEQARRVPRMLAEIVARGVDALLVVSERDPGIDFVDRYAPESMREVERMPGFRRVDLPGTDHTFTSLWSQRRVAEVITLDYLPRHRGDA